MVLYENLMFFDPEVKITGELPEELREWCNIMDKAFYANDNYTYNKYGDDIGTFAKNCWSNNEITTEQREAIWNRYCTGG